MLVLGGSCLGRGLGSRIGLTASVADGVSCFVSPPQGCDSCTAVLASNHDALLCNRRPVCRALSLCLLIGIMARCSERNLCSFRYAIVVRRTSAASVVTTGAVASSTSGAGSVGDLVCLDVVRAALHRCWRCASLLWLAVCWVCACCGASFEAYWAHLVASFVVETASVANNCTSRRAPP